MIHSIVSLNDIFADNRSYQTVTEQVSCGYAEYSVINGKKQLVRLISTDPAQYLKNEYQPFVYYR